MVTIPVKQTSGQDFDRSHKVQKNSGNLPLPQTDSEVRFFKSTCVITCVKFNNGLLQALNGIYPQRLTWPVSFHCIPHPIPHPSSFLVSSPLGKLNTLLGEVPQGRGPKRAPCPSGGRGRDTQPCHEPGADLCCLRCTSPTTLCSKQLTLNSKDNLRCQGSTEEITNRLWPHLRPAQEKLSPAERAGRH